MSFKKGINLIKYENEQKLNNILKLRDTDPVQFRKMVESMLISYGEDPFIYGSINDMIEDIRILINNQKRDLINIYTGNEDEGVYEGETKEMKHGYGKFVYNNGDIYIGEWRCNQRHGNGKIIYANGIVAEGYWENDIEIETHDTYFVRNQTASGRQELAWWEY